LQCFTQQAIKQDFQSCHRLSETLPLAYCYVTERVRLTAFLGAHAKKGFRIS
jgi:hypothetical protein